MVGKRHLVIPDTQVKPGVPIQHFRWLAMYANDHGPDRIIHLGDHYDMPSLSAYDKPGSHAAEGRRVAKDLSSGHRALELFAKNLKIEVPQHVTLGNHEDRVMRAVRDDARLEGLIGVDSFKFEEFGWKVHGFQQIIPIDGIWYSHFFDIGPSGHPTGRGAGQASARVQLMRVHASCVAGHRQGYDMYAWPRHGPIRGKTSVIAGSCYLHQEEYRGPNGNNEYRGALMLNEVQHRNYQPMQVSLEYLRQTYGKYRD